MQFTPHASRPLIALACMLFAACADDATGPVEPAESPAFAVGSHGSGSFQFDPLASEAICVVGGSGDRFDLPDGYTQEILVRESSIEGQIGGTGEDLFDMLTLNETGLQAGRFLYRTHEPSSNGALTRTDLWTGETILISQDPGYSRLDGIAWTPWQTVLFAEEAAQGRLFEYDPATDAIAERPYLGLRRHEGIRVDAQGNVYGISETTPGAIFRFVPDVRGDLSSGTLYALKVDDAASRTGPAMWVELDIGPSSPHGFDSDAAAAATGATGWSRPEDVEIATSTGGARGGANVMYVAITGEDRVLRIELNGDEAYVSNFIDDPAGFDNPDNLALSPSGDLYVAEDNGPGDLWVSRTGGLEAEEVVRFASLRDCGAEPTGIYFDRNGRTLFVQVQHASWEGGDDLTVAIRRSR